MQTSLCLIGWGVGNFNLLKNLSETIEKHNLKITINLLIIDKYFKDIHGGISYGKNLSKHGYFNNPCRLSPKDFVKWVYDKKNRKKLLDYLRKYGGNADTKWIITHGNTLLKAKKLKDLDELYLPRVFYGIWMQNKFEEIINKKKIKLNYIFIKGEVTNIKKKKNFDINIKKNYKIISYSKKNNLSFLNKEYEFVSLSLGVLPPKKNYKLNLKII